MENKLLLFGILLLLFGLFTTLVNAQTQEKAVFVGESALFQVEIANTGNTDQVLSLGLENENQDKGILAVLDQKQLVLSAGEKKSVGLDVKASKDTLPGNYSVFLVGEGPGKQGYTEKLEGQELVLVLDDFTVKIVPESIALVVDNEGYGLEDDELRFEAKDDGGIISFIPLKQYNLNDRFNVKLEFEDEKENLYLLDFDVRLVDKEKQRTDRVVESFQDREEQLFIVLKDFPKQIDEESIFIDIDGQKYMYKDREFKIKYMDDDLVLVVEEEFRDGERLPIQVSFDDEIGNEFDLFFTGTIGGEQLEELKLFVRIDEDELQEELNGNSVQFVFEGKEYDIDNSELRVNEEEKEIVFTAPRSMNLPNGGRYEFRANVKDRDGTKFNTSGAFVLALQQREEVSDDLLEDILNNRQFDLGGAIFLELDELRNEIDPDSVKLKADDERYDRDDTELSVRFDKGDSRLNIELDETRFKEGEKVEVIVEFEDKKTNDYELRYEFDIGETDVRDLELIFRLNELKDRLNSKSLRLNSEGKTYVIEDGELSADSARNEVRFQLNTSWAMGKRMRFSLDAEDDLHNSARISGLLTLDFEKDFSARSKLEEELDNLMRRNLNNYADSLFEDQAIQDLQFELTLNEFTEDIKENKVEFKFNGVSFNEGDNELEVFNNKIRFKSKTDFDFGKELGFYVKAEDEDEKKYSSSGKISVGFGKTSKEIVVPGEDKSTLRKEVKFSVKVKPGTEKSDLQIVAFPEKISLSPGEKKKLVFSVYNSGSEKLDNVEVRLRGLNAQTNFDLIKVGALGAKETKQVESMVEAALNADNKKYYLTLEAVSSKGSSVQKILFESKTEKTEQAKKKTGLMGLVTYEIGLELGLGILALILIAAFLIKKSSEKEDSQSFKGMKGLIK